jgi:hypothetical protein
MTSHLRAVAEEDSNFPHIEVLSVMLHHTQNLWTASKSCAQVLDLVRRGAAKLKTGDSEKKKKDYWLNHMSV